MKTMIVPLVLASIAGVLYGSDESLANTQEPEDHELRELVEARRDTLKEVVSLINEQEDVGRVSISEVSRANTSFFEADLEAARTPKERIACFQRAYEAQQRTEQRTEIGLNVGTVKPVDVLLARAARLKAEAELNGARIDLGEIEVKASLESTAEIRNTNDAAIHRLLATRYDTLKEAAQLIQAERDVGSVSIEMVSRVNEPLLEAALELTGRSEEGVAIREKMLADKRKIEEHFQARWKANILKEQYFLAAKADREEAAIKLHRARRGKWRERMGRNDALTFVTQDEPIDQELQTLLVEHRDTLKTIRQFVDKDINTGVVQIGDMINANKAYFNAELELAKSPQERIVILEEALEKQTDVESIANAKMEVGTGYRAELLIAKAARLKVEIDLHKARKNAK
jgi:hypothetical protein